MTPTYHSRPRRTRIARLLIVVLAVIGLLATPRTSRAADATATDQPVFISGVYPHLTVYNDNQGEVGIGAVVPWAGKLWVVTYPPHRPKGSPDKLYAISPDMKQEVRPESVGGTHADRMIHRESDQLIIGPYFIDNKGNVRAADVNKLVGRLTAVARHLTDPANRVYFYDMEGALYEVDVHSLAVTKLFDRVAPGAHGKGGYTGQGRLIVSNNGDKGPNEKAKPAAPDPAKNSKDPGVTGALAEWDGKDWRVVERHQFTDVTGPDGILGSPDDKAPVWAIGWDKRSVILKLLDGGTWSTFRLPKASHAYDPAHGWFTEWPRIREVATAEGGHPRRLMMDMHGMFYDFPATFTAANTAGLAPIGSHLRYVPDFCQWNGRLVLATDEVSSMQNPMAGQSQSNLWFGTLADLKHFGPSDGWGGPWVGDAVKAGEPSDPFLINGFDRRVLHLVHTGADEIKFTLEVDAKGDGKWAKLADLPPTSKGYGYFAIPKDVAAQWARLTADHDCANTTAYFHLTQNPRPELADDKMFRGLADVGEPAGSWGIIRPSGANRNLQFLAADAGAGGAPAYLEVDERLAFTHPAESRAAEVEKVAAVKTDFAVDDASVIMTQEGKRYRLPKGDAAYDKPFAGGWPRGIREVESERNLMNIHGTFYEMPRTNGLPLIKPVATHRKQIMDFCTWRGLLVLSGTRAGASIEPDGHRFASPDGKASLWFGAVDDLWRLGAPTGVGGPWAKTAVKAGQASDPYLMTGYNKKRVELSHDAAGPVAFTIEVDFDHRFFHKYQTITVDPGKTVTHEFPDGYSAHWARVTVDKACTATARFVYER